MASGQLGSLLQHIRRLIGAAPAGAVPDGQLLEQFCLNQDEAAFTALVQRHGPLVLGACRRLVHDAEDAEDAFQATFLVLARKAAAIRKPEALSSWLYGVAYRVATRARAENLQRRAHEQQVPAMSAISRNDELNTEPAGVPADPMTEAARRELRSVLDEELNRLPAKYRMPMVLCYLEGKSNEEAAEQLRWTKGTVSGRLARARDLLRHRLARRGVALSAGAVAVAVSQNAAPAAVPAALVDATVKGACVFSVATAGAAAAGSAKAVALAEGALHAMSVAKIKLAAAVLVAVSVAGSGTAVVAYHTLKATQPPAEIALPTAGVGKPEADSALPGEVDPVRFANAAIVMRVKRHGAGQELNHFRWQDVEIIKVYKNTPGELFTNRIVVGSQLSKAGVPAQECTLYVEAHPDSRHWQLLGGGAPDGVSHVAAHVDKHKAGH